MNYDVCIYVRGVGGMGEFKRFMFLAVLILTQLLLLWEESKPSLPFTYLHPRTDRCYPLTQKKGISASMPVPFDSLPPPP